MSSSTLSTDKQGRLSLLTKLAYGVGEIAPSMAGNIRTFFLLFFLTNVAGMSGTTAGIVLLIGRVWDIFIDPVIGWLSDRTISRWGRRHSWMIYGAIPFGLFFFLQWIVPTSESNLLFWYYVIIALLFDTAFTAVTLPLSALAPELTQDYSDRTSLISFKSSFSLGGGILGLLLAQIVFSKVSDPNLKYAVLGGVCALLSIVAIYLSVWGTRHRVASQDQYHQIEQSASIPLRSQIRIVFSNQPFVLLMGIYLCSWLAVNVTATVLPYYVVNWMGLPDQDFTQTAIAVQVSAMLMMIVWNSLSKSIGKRAIYFMGIPLWIIAQIGLFILQPQQVGLMYLMAVLAGIGVSVAYLAPWAMLPDVIDLDELHTGQKREGIFYGFVVQLTKIGVAITLFLVGKSLDWSGFIASNAQQPLPTQPDSTLWTIRLMMSLLPAVILIGGLILTYLYPITKTKHEEILLKLRQEKERLLKP
jgi:GPH family glycoside/pentoside/hexuronide:cation symporter